MKIVSQILKTDIVKKFFGKYLSTLKSTVPDFWEYILEKLRAFLRSLVLEWVHLLLEV